MTVAKLTRSAIGLGLLLSSCGTTASALAQTETRTVRERVVVMLPSGKRIVRMVEKQVPVEVTREEAPTPSLPGIDPFSIPGDDSGDSANRSGGNGSGNSIDPRIIEWISWYRANDSRADANGDGRVTAADFNAYLAWLSEQDNPGGDDGNNGDGGNDTGPDSPSDDTGSDDGSNGSSDDDSDTGDSGDAGPSVPETGWTELSPSADSRVIYVSEAGNDSNDGLSPSRPLRTVSEGVRRLRSGSPDWLMLRRGDTWSESLGSWKKSGRSSSEPMVITAYGEGPRPRLITGTTTGLSVLNTERRRHLAFVSLAFEPGVRHQKTGMNFVGGNISDVLVEDCFISGYQAGVVIQGFNGRLADFRLRRNVIIDIGGSSHSQGVFSSNTDGLLMEGNIFDRCGWRADRGREATAGIFAHNLYIQRTNTNVVFRDNWSSRAAAEGYKSRAGGDVHGNVFWQNPIAVSYGNDGTNRDDRPAVGSINDNLVLETIDMTSTDLRGWGIRIHNTADVQVRRNIVANAVSQRGFGIAVRSERTRGKARGLVIEDNIIDDHGDGLEIDRDLVIDVTLRDNLSTASGGSKTLVQLRGSSNASGLSISGNRYEHGASGEPFLNGGSTLSLNEWQASFDPAGGSLLADYADEDAVMNDYAREIGFANAGAMLEAMRQQRKGNWNEDLEPSKMRAFFERAFRTNGG